MAHWILSNIRFEGLAAGLFAAISMLFVGHFLDRLIFGNGKRIVARFAFLAIPLVLVPSWHPDYPGTFDPQAAHKMHGNNLPFLSRMLHSQGSSWRWAREVGVRADDERLGNVEQISGITDKRLAQLAYDAHRADRSNAEWTPIARSGPALDFSAPLLVRNIPVAAERGPLAGFGFQELYQYKGGVRVSIYLVSKAPSWQYRIGSKVSTDFGVWLSSISAFQAAEQTYWMFILLAALVTGWITRRAIHSFRVAKRFRMPGDQQPLIADALIVFLLGPQEGLPVTSGFTETFNRRSPFRPDAARREYYKDAISTNEMAIATAKKKLCLLWLRRRIELLSGR